MKAWVCFAGNLLASFWPKEEHLIIADTNSAKTAVASHCPVGVAVPKALGERREEWQLT